MYFYMSSSMNVELNTGQYSREIIDRFLNKVEKTDNCWLWTGACRGGLSVAQFQIKQGQIISARKFAYNLWVGTITPGCQVLTSCRNKLCVNPNHLCLSHGRPDVELNPLDISRFWSYVDKTGGPEACWPWLGSTRGIGPTNNSGLRYGTFSLAGSNAFAHRVAYAIAHNIQTPKNLHVRHQVCDNPICCNPSHLALGTVQDNMDDKTSRNRQARIRGERNTTAVVTEEMVREIRALRGNARKFNHGKMPLKEIAKKFNIALSTAGKICARDLWAHVE